MLARAALRKRQNKGAIVPLVAICLIPLMFGLAMAVDVGYMYVVQAELQAAADAAALAAAGEMSGASTDVYLQEAAAAAKLYANQHSSLGMTTNLVLADEDIEFGDATFDSSTGRWQFVPNSASEAPYAVRVTVRRNGDQNPSVPRFFSRLLGANEGSQSASAVAMIAPRDIALVVDLSHVNWHMDRQFAIDGPVSGSSVYSPGVQRTVAEPLQALKDAVQEFTGYLNEVEANDEVGLVVYGTNGAEDPYSASNVLTNDYDVIADLPYPLQAGEHGTFTNTAEALLRGYKMIHGRGFRPHAQKVIVFMSDAELNVVGVGADGDLENLLIPPAAANVGEAYYAEPDLNDPQALPNLLKEIYKKIGGRRPVALISQ